MAIKDFFRTNIKTEEMLINKNKETITTVSTLEAIIGGAMVLGSLAGIFTIPTLLAVSIPAIIGLTTINSIKKSNNDSRDRIQTLKNMEEQGVDASRNHERNVKINELTEEKNKEIKKNDKYSKIMIGGIAAFAIGGFASIAAAVAAPLMICGYGTMLYGLYKANETSDNGRKIQHKIEKLKDSIAASNLNPRFITTTEKADFTEEKKADKNVEKKADKNVEKKFIKKNKRDAAIDEYIENLAKQTTTEEINNKTK